VGALSSDLTQTASADFTPMSAITIFRQMRLAFLRQRLRQGSIKGGRLGMLR